MIALVTALAMIGAPVTPGAHYAANWLFRFFFGSQWRDAWTAQIEAPVLDLDTFDGGLVPERTGGGLQTTNIHFKSARGNRWVFRAIDKDPTRILDPDTARSVVGEIFQDLTSTAHPCGALVVDPIMDAVGVLHARPQLAVLPDDLRLRPFGDLGGKLGFLENRNEREVSGADKELDTRELFELLDSRGDRPVDARAYLRARLVDILVGDWDRHIDQWRWVRVAVDGHQIFRPVARDRDQAFSRFDKIVPAVGEYYTKQLASFHPNYPAIEKLTYSGRFTDRRFLVALPKMDWEEITADVAAKVTDGVIHDAVQRLPPAMVRVGGEDLESALRARRDALPEASREFYRLLAAQVDIRDPEDAGPIEVTPVPDGVSVAIRRGGETIFQRTFLRDETSEIRLLTTPARVAIDPAAREVITLRVPERVDPSPEPPRDWGHDLLFFPQLSYDSTRGLVPGVRGRLTRYGFELTPFSSDMNFSAVFSTAVLQPRLEYSADLRTRSIVRGLVYLAYTGIDQIRFYGIGNETSSTGAPPGFYDVHQRRFVANGLVEVPLLGPLRARAGLSLESANTRPENIIAVLRPYGGGSFTLAGVETGLALDTRSGTLTEQRGFKLLGKVRYSPALFDNDSAFTKLRGEASTFLGGHILTDLLLDLRVAGERNWGRYPFFDAAFIGGTAFVSGLDPNAVFGGGVLRGYDLNRFAGDSSVVGNAELRITLGKATVFLPLRYGLSALGDTGRVFVAGESSSKWHYGAGGGLWLAIYASAAGAVLSSSVNATIVRSDERTSFYFSSGFGL
ncbi:MAG: hypothetical protein ACJ78V_19885 [Myxococcales bacterium]